MKITPKLLQHKASMMPKQESGAVNALNGAADELSRLISEGATREKAAFLAGWDFYNASQSRMDLPRNRIGAYNHWKATVSEGLAPE